MGTLYWNAQRVKNMSIAVQKTQSIEHELHELEADLLNAETGQRGYLLTQDKDYLQPYLAGKNSIPARIKFLHEWITDPQPLANLQSLEAIITAKMDEIGRITVAFEFHTRIFQMFQTLRSRDEVEGSGMGLAIVQKIVENFGGKIRVESSAAH